MTAEKSLERALPVEFKGHPIIKKSISRLRGFSASKTTLLTNSWTTTSLSAYGELKDALAVLRARSRDLAMNNDYAQKFFSMVVVNVVGPAGITLQNKARDISKGGKTVLDKPANDQIEAAWERWGQRGICTVCGRYSFVDVQRLVLESIARDGDVLIRLVRGAKNNFGFALQLIEADHLDEKLNSDLTDGRIIRMGVEYDIYNRPVAYHVRVKHPGDYGYYTPSGQVYERIPASEIIHPFISKRVHQPRGIPWMTPVMEHLNMLAGYDEAELVAARTSSSKMGIIQTPSGSEFAGVGLEDETVVIDGAPGSFQQLPRGWEMKLFDPQHPSANFDAFRKSILRAIASGLNVAYNSLGNDLEGANYGSIRAGSIEERDSWRILQQWFISVCVNEIFKAWLEMALLTVLNLPIEKYSKFNAPSWQVRGWQWIDPLKDVKANIEAIKFGLKTRTQVAAEQGRDLEEIFEELSVEKKLAEAYDLRFEADMTGLDTAISNTQEVGQ